MHKKLNSDNKAVYLKKKNMDIIGKLCPGKNLYINYI